ncbi:MAG: response regulator transcription factor [Acidimicrobiia bacterium]
MHAGAVLLIEDDDDIAAMLRLHVEREGFSLVHVPTGEGGLDHVRRTPPQAVLLDIGLPGIDGVNVARLIRESTEVPILMISARDTETDMIVGLDVGADDYITKPFSPREVMARLHAVLRRSRANQHVGSTRTIRGFVIDGDRREVTLPGGGPVRPTVKEFDLLWYLVDNAGLVLSRSQILEAVWGYDYFGDPRTVDVHVRQLRKKLDGFLITTEWGIGYRVENE